eukprot:7223872-Pyramimonas_sp.AAC.4
MLHDKAVLRVLATQLAFRLLRTRCVAYGPVYLQHHEEEGVLPPDGGHPELTNDGRRGGGVGPRHPRARVAA